MLDGHNKYFIRLDQPHNSRISREFTPVSAVTPASLHLNPRDPRPAGHSPPDFTGPLPVPRTGRQQPALPASLTSVNSSGNHITVAYTSFL